MIVTNADPDTLIALQADYGKWLSILSTQNEARIRCNNPDMAKDVRNRLEKAGWIVTVL